MLYVCHRVFAVSEVMSGCLDKCTCPDWEIWNTIRERRNFLSSVIAGAMVCMIQHVCLSILCAMLSLLTEVELCSKSEHVFLQRAQCSHCKRCISYGNSVRLSVCPSVCHTPVLCQNDGT